MKAIILQLTLILWKHWSTFVSFNHFFVTLSFTRIISTSRSLRLHKTLRTAFTNDWMMTKAGTHLHKVLKQLQVHLPARCLICRWCSGTCWARPSWSGQRSSAHHLVSFSVQHSENQRLLVFNMFHNTTHHDLNCQMIPLGSSKIQGRQLTFRTRTNLPPDHVFKFCSHFYIQNSLKETHITTA